VVPEVLVVVFSSTPFFLDMKLLGGIKEQCNQHISSCQLLKQPPDLYSVTAKIEVTQSSEMSEQTVTA
jgi:hypothetical protein